MYGVQNQRSYSAGENDFGSRFAKASSGFVSALTYNLRYCPGLPASSCATESGASTASSSGPPDERRPTTLIVIQRLWSPALTFSSSPTFAPNFFEKLTPTRHWREFSPNHSPSTFHQGFVFSTPLT